MNTPTTAVGITASLTLTGLLLTGCTTPTTPATDDTTPGPGPDTATTVLFGFDTSGSTRGRQHDYLTAASAWLNAHPTITTAHVISLDATAGTASTCPTPNPDLHATGNNTPTRKRAATRKRATFTTQLRTWLACEQTHHTPGGSDLLPFAAITALHPTTVVLFTDALLATDQLHLRKALTNPRAARAAANTLGTSNTLTGIHLHIHGAGGTTTALTDKQLTALTTFWTTTITNHGGHLDTITQTLTP